jgi:hypothetical protein
VRLSAFPLVRRLEPGGAIRAIHMPYPINSKHFESVTKLDPERRYLYSIKRIADWAELWALESSPLEEGTAEPIKIWPHSHFAEMYNEQLTKPIRIEVHEWLDNWIPELDRVHRVVAIFPFNDAGKVISADALKRDLKEELSKIED